MRNRLMLTTIFLAGMASAQPVVSSTPEQVGSPRGENTGDYNVMHSFETGYRWSLIDGNLGKYRSDVNYGNGIRLLSSSLTVNSRDGHGHYFDEIRLNTLGLGNDPYEAANLRVQKNRLYRYDMLWRSNEYFNPGLTISFGEHQLDTRRVVQDHDLTLFPESRFKFHFGYSRNDQSGPALSTVLEPVDIAARADDFPIFMNVRRQQNDYRLGGEFDLFGFHLTLQHNWEDFKEDTPYSVNGFEPGNNPNDRITLSQFQRLQPYHGTSPGWLANLTTQHKRWAANGRLTYVGGRRNFVFDESSLGTDFSGGPATRQVAVGGNARRPVTTGDLSLSLFPTTRLTLVNNTSIDSTRIDGDAAYREFSQATLTSDVIYFQFLGIRAVTNSTDLHYRASDWLSVYGGYHYATRHFRSIEDTTVFGGTAGIVASQDNTIHSGLLGLRLRPIKPLSINLDAEIARADHPFTPVSDRNLHALGARADYRRKNFTFSAGYKQNYNVNSVSVSTHSARARNYNANLAWTPRGWFALDAGYAKLHLDTVSGLAFFAGGAFVQNRESIYISNIHAGNLSARFGLGKRVDLYAGYTISRDTGGNRTAATDPVSLVLVPVQTFPLTYHSPLARVSIKITPKIRWNAGWQFYRYHEEFGLFSVFQNYRAHTGYSSILWSF